MSSDVVQGIQIIVGIALGVVPLVVLIWALLMARSVAVEAHLLRRQLQEIARHTGAPIVTERGVQRPVPRDEAGTRSGPPTPAP